MDKLYIDEQDWEARCNALLREERRKVLLANPDTAQQLLATLPAIWRDEAQFQEMMRGMTDASERRRRRERARREGQQ